MRRIKPVLAMLVLVAIVIVGNQIGITPAAALDVVTGVMAQLGVSVRDLVAAKITMTKSTKTGRNKRRKWTLKAKTVECVCTMCGTAFEARAGAKYCSAACKQQAWRERQAGTFTSHTAPQD